MPIMPATWEAEARKLPEPRRQRLQRVKIVAIRKVNPEGKSKMKEAGVRDNTM